MKTFMTLVMLLACGIHAVLSVDGNESSANLSGNSNWIYQFGTVLLAVILIGWSLYRFTRTPTVETLEANYTALIGERVELKCSVAATPWITSVSWQLILPGGRSVPLIIDQRKYKGSKPYDPHLVINELTKDDEGEYVCTVSNLCGKGQSAPTKLNVEGDFPTVRIHERNYTAVLGEQVKLECTISAIPWITTVSWQRISPEEQPVALDIDEIKYTGSKPNDPHLSINDIKKDDEGDYVCTVSNLCGKRQSAPTKLKVKGGPPTLNMKPKKHYKTEGDVAILKCNVIAEPPASDITWTKEEEGCKRKIATDNDKYYGGLLESPSLVIDETEKMHDEGKYICEAENLAGPGSNSVHLTINSKSANTETIPDALILNEDNPYTLEERATDCHSMMVNKLSGVIYPASDCWENFKQLLKGRLPPVVLQKDNLHLYVQKLLDANRIQIGQYKPLYKAVKGVNKCASGIIKEAESEIKTIRRQGMPNETPAKLECKFQGRYINPNLPVMCTCQMQKQCPEVNGRIKGTGGSGCIYLKFTISEAKTPHQLSALYLAEILKTRLENRQIVLKDESDQPLVLKHSPRVMIPTENPTDKPTIRLSRGHYRFTEGKVAILKCVVVATAETEYIKWVRVKDGKSHAICIDNEKYFGGLPKSPSLAIGDVVKSDGGTYFCRARNRAGEVESDVAFVEINSIGDLRTRNDDVSTVIKDIGAVIEDAGPMKEDVDVAKFTKAVQQGKFEDIGKLLQNRDFELEPFLVNPLLIVAVFGSPEVVEYIEKCSSIECDWNDNLEIRSGVCDSLLDEMKDRKATPLFVATFLENTATVKSLVKYSDKRNIAYCMKNLHLNKSMEKVYMTEFGERLKIKYSRLKPAVVPGHQKKTDGTWGRVFVIYSRDVLRPDDHVQEGIGLVMLRNPYEVNKEDLIVSNSQKPNRSISEQDNERAKQAIQLYSKKLWCNHINLNIIRVSSVRSCKGNIVEPEVCVVLCCITKGVVPLGEKEFPTRLAISEDDFIYTDVREGIFTYGGYDTRPSTFRHDYLKMGCDISSISEQNFGGTIGPFVNYEGNLSFLTCAHVLFDVGQQHDVDFTDDGIRKINVVQPGMSSSVPSGDPCGFVKRAIFDPSLDPSIDVAVVTISDPARIPKRGRFANDHSYKLARSGFMELPEYNTGSIDFDARISLSSPVFKFGSRTHLTRGVLVHFGIEVRPLSCTMQTSSKAGNVWIKNQYEVLGLEGQSFFEPGDSGAAVFSHSPFDRSLCCIGIAIGSLSNGSAIVTPIGAVLKALGEHHCEMASFP